MIAYVINPGSTSTKLALAHIESSETPELPGKLRLTLERHEVSHPDTQGTQAERSAQMRALIAQAVATWPRPDAVVGRGGLIGPLRAGTYEVTSELAQFALNSPYGDHASNLGATLALELAQQHGVPAFIVDPPSVDELLPEARVSGFPGIERSSRFHALNARAVARRAAHEVGKRFQDSRIVVAHLGGGISVTAFAQGRAVDTSGALLDEGPFSPQRAGTLPTRALLDLAYRTERAELEQLLTNEGGFKGLVGTADLRELEQREKTEIEVRVVVQAFIHQVSKSIGAYSAIGGRPDAVAITGGVARWDNLVRRIEDNVGWIAPVIVLPGELELEALAEGAGRVLLGLEQLQDWRATTT
ncbi:butyrate kinase [Deinococcus peraridilitoris]|uniref:Probable butyrate kinase n=1 Tax=Deinococcus peraridilitoris (strain DSM 19664 / LMG 22246 / CIP 109416 / KR-200) TaxID=937777 RepID=K9ZXK2_DEIPD|nr:butyrate kinase [Deinococcus peraridilitoris]AFZ65929.1 butyrate kinase [Deinococcus peraridilitoris DSM 19664]